MAQRLVSMGQGLANWAVRTSLVSWETVKLVATHNRVGIPNPAEFGQAIGGVRGFFGSFVDGSWRYVTVRDTASLAARGVEVLGFFTVGEMIGRGSMVGYNIPLPRRRTPLKAFTGEM